MVATEQINQEAQSFEKLLEESLGTTSLAGKVVEGRVIGVDNSYVIVDVGLKSEGRIPLSEFTSPGKASEIKAGEKVDVYVEKMEDKDGLIVLSREKARREAAWKELEVAWKKNERVNGVIFGRVKGGFTVDLKGAVAFLPGSQLDIRPIKDASPLFDIDQPFVILKMDALRGNIVVSRRAILEESRTEARSELLSKIKKGKVLEGIVKNITGYGAFVDLGGADGLLHVTDISWERINNPSEVLQVGQTIKVMVIEYNEETNRISLGMKQLEKDPWENIENKYKVGSKLTGRITKITDYGAFVALEPGIEGLIHVSEMSWTKKNLPPSKIVSTSQEVEVMVLEVDSQKRRIALGMKQCLENPWQKVASQYPVSTVFEGKIRNITEFGLFVAITDDLDGMVHMSDISWEQAGEEAIKNYKKDDTVKVKVLEVDPDKERIALGIKQLSEDPFQSSLTNLKKGDTVTCEVKTILDSGIEVIVNNSLPGFIRKTDLSKERSEQRPDRYAVGEKVDAKVLSIDPKTRKISLSIKSQEIHEEKQAMATYGSTDSGASLGDILGAAFDKVKDKQKEEPKEEKKTKKAKKEDLEAASDEEVAEKPKKAKKASKKTDDASEETEADEKPKKKAATKKTTKKTKED
jgi:small subunit ribosomal protein S1